jgi:hypothetical protein
MTLRENCEQLRETLLAEGIEPAAALLVLLSAFEQGLMTEAELREACGRTGAVAGRPVRAPRE